MSMDTKNINRYPTRCLSAYCGKSGDDCNSECPNWENLQAFKQWVLDNHAVCVDPIWSPNLFRIGVKDDN